MASSDDEPPPEAPTAADLVKVRRVLEALVRDRRGLAAVDAAEREALLMAAGRLSRPERNELRKLARLLRTRDRSEKRAHDAALVETTGMRQSRRESTFGVPSDVGASAPPPPPADWRPERLIQPLSCYVCKADFDELHHFYDKMCPPCATLNWAKRFQTADLTGKVVVITGARVKIGYQAVLILLRAGARVVATTRFARDAARRFAREPDAEAWSSRLEVHGIDLRHAPSVEVFARHLRQTLPRLDALVNNAAQTVRHAPAFFGHLLGREAASLDALPPGEMVLLAAGEQLRARASGGDPELLAGVPMGSGGAMVAWGGAPALGLIDPAGLTQVPLTPDDLDRDPALYPVGALDADEQQVDLRAVNSWRLGADDVATPELLETHLVNAIAPFILTTRLAPLLERSKPAHVVQVSAMEASFDRRVKTDKHPHTNMAKASLNMLTRTSAVDYAARGIYMNSVDTGWVTDEDPYAHVVRKAHHGFSPPLDAIDGAARVLDPIFVGLATGDHPWGHFFKDYGTIKW